MTISPIPLRELKKAKNKIALYEASMSLIEAQVFRDVMLDDICRVAEVSRVTFFNLFRKKEELLLYYMRVWLTDKIIDIKEQQLRGFDAVRHLFGCVADQASEKPGIMPSLIAFLVEMKMHPEMPKLSQAEIQLLFPGHEKLGSESPNMFALFEQCISEAHQDGTLKDGISIPEAIQFLFTVFYGAFLTSQLYASKDIRSFYDTQLRFIEIEI